MIVRFVVGAVFIGLRYMKIMYEGNRKARFGFEKRCAERSECAENKHQKINITAKYTHEVFVIILVRTDQNVPPLKHGGK